MKEVKYIRFVDISQLNKITKTFLVVNKNSNNPIGEIKWYSIWRQYCFFPGESTIYSKGCLQDINAFIIELMNERKKKSNLKNNYYKNL